MNYYAALTDQRIPSVQLFWSTFDSRAEDIYFLCPTSESTRLVKSHLLQIWLDIRHRLLGSWGLTFTQTDSLCNIWRRNEMVLKCYTTCFIYLMELPTFFSRGGMNNHTVCVIYLNDGPYLFCSSVVKPYSLLREGPYEFYNWIAELCSVFKRKFRNDIKRVDIYLGVTNKWSGDVWIKSLNFITHTALQVSAFKWHLSQTKCPMIQIIHFQLTDRWNVSILGFCVHFKNPCTV